MIDIDAMMETKEASAWLRLRPRELLARSKGRKAKIPGFWLNERVVRYHPRTIIAKMAFDAGVPAEAIAASFNQKKATNL